MLTKQPACRRPPNAQLSTTAMKKTKKKGKPNPKPDGCSSLQRKLGTLVYRMRRPFNPIAFVVPKTLNLSAHEPLLKRIGLWDFIHLQFDTKIRSDLIQQLATNYDPDAHWARRSSVNDVPVSLNRVDVATALFLPTDRRAIVGGSEKVSEAEVTFLGKLVYYYVVLYGEDDDENPNLQQELQNFTQFNRKGRPDMVNWSGLIWFMMERELLKGHSLGDCYYAQHLQCLLKYQKPFLFDDVVEEEKDCVEVVEESVGGRQLCNFEAKEIDGNGHIVCTNYGKSLVAKVDDDEMVDMGEGGVTDVALENLQFGVNSWAGDARDDIEAIEDSVELEKNEPLAEKQDEIVHVSDNGGDVGLENQQLGLSFGKGHNVGCDIYIKDGVELEENPDGKFCSLEGEPVDKGQLALVVKQDHTENEPMRENLDHLVHMPDDGAAALSSGKGHVGDVVMDIEDGENLEECAGRELGNLEGKSIDNRQLVKEDYNEIEILTEKLDDIVHMSCGGVDDGLNDRHAIELENGAIVMSCAHNEKENVEMKVKGLMKEGNGAEVNISSLDCDIQEELKSEQNYMLNKQRKTCDDVDNDPKFDIGLVLPQNDEELVVDDSVEEDEAAIEVETGPSGDSGTVLEERRMDLSAKDCRIGGEEDVIDLEEYDEDENDQWGMQRCTVNNLGTQVENNGMISSRIVICSMPMQPKTNMNVGGTSVNTAHLLQAQEGLEAQAKGPRWSGFHNSTKRNIHSMSDATDHLWVGESKRMRREGVVDFKSCLEQAHTALDVAQVKYEEREREWSNSQMNANTLVMKLQERDNVIQNLIRTKEQEIQKKNWDIYRLQRELTLMGEAIIGCKKALQETRMAFADYRLRQ